MSSLRRKAAPLACAWVFTWVADAQSTLPPGSVVLFETGFEKFEGYAPNQDLSGQNGWIEYGDGGNGVLDAALPGFSGQYAYIGFAPPAHADGAVNVWRPVGFAPAGGAAVVEFNVRLQINDSTVRAPYFDDFRWSVYNAAEHRLFSIDFDNDTRTVNYVLESDTNGAAVFHPTGWSFNNGQPYNLTVVMDLARNLWTARINDTVIAGNQPLTRQGAGLDISDVDAVWVLRTAGKPGDNYMIFDDYRVAATPLDAIPPTVEWVGWSPAGAAVVRVHGEPGVRYQLEASEDLNRWTVVGAALIQVGNDTVDVQDTQATRFDSRVYRAVSVAGP